MALGPALVATRGWFGAEVLENYQRAIELCPTSERAAERALATYGLATVTELRGEYERTDELLTPMLDDPMNVVVVETRELLACCTFHEGEFQRTLDNAFSVLKVRRVSGER